MFQSLHTKLLPHQDYVGVLPTHGGGSRRHNALLQIDEVGHHEHCQLPADRCRPRLGPAGGHGADGGLLARPHRRRRGGQRRSGAGSLGRLRGRYDHVFAEVRDFPTRYGVPGLAQAVYRALPEGARFLTAGTFYWGWGLDPSYARRHAVPEGFTRLTANVLAFLAGD